MSERFQRRRLGCREVPLTPEQAWEIRQAELRALLDDLREIIKSPLPTTRSERYYISPGEPGYDEAPYEEVIEYHPWVIRLPIDEMPPSDCAYTDLRPNPPSFPADPIKNVEPPDAQ